MREFSWPTPASLDQINFPPFGPTSWARHNWLRRHTGSFGSTFAIAVFFGLLSGSAVALFGLVAFAILCTAIA